MAFKMAPRSPLMKSLKGGQKNLPEGLKKAIEAAPGKMMDSPAKMGRGEKYDVKMASDQNLTAGARKNYAENAEAAQKSSPAKASRKADGDKAPMPPTGDSPAKNMNKGYGSPAKVVGPGRKGKKKKGVSPELAKKQAESTRASDASAFRDSLKEKNAKKAEASGDTGRAKRIRSSKNTQ